MLFKCFVTLYDQLAIVKTYLLLIEKVVLMKNGRIIIYYLNQFSIKLNCLFDLLFSVEYIFGWFQIYWKYPLSINKVDLHEYKLQFFFKFSLIIYLYRI